MRTIFFLATMLIAGQGLQAQDYRLYWKYKDYDNTVAFVVPGGLMDIGSLFIKEREGKKMLRRVNKVRIMFSESGNVISKRDMKRFDRRAKRRHLDDLIAVRDGKTQVRIMAKVNRRAIRKLVVFFNSPEDGYGMVSIKGRLKWEDINKLISKYGDKMKKEGKKPIVPPAAKVPVVERV